MSYIYITELVNVIKPNPFLCFQIPWSNFSKKKSHTGSILEKEEASTSGVKTQTEQVAGTLKVFKINELIETIFYLGLSSFTMWEYKIGELKSN